MDSRFELTASKNPYLIVFCESVDVFYLFS